MTQLTVGAGGLSPQAPFRVGIKSYFILNMFYFLGFLFPFPFDRDFNIFCVFLSTMSSPLVFFDSASFLALSPASFPFIDCSSFETVG